MNLSIHGGLNEIGGNKILVEDKGTRVWLDFGTSFKRMGMFFDEFMKPRKHNGLGDFFELGLLPDFKGLYRCDFLQKCSRGDEKPAFDGVLLSHAHIDHSGMIPLLNKEIPIYCSSPSRLILKAMQDTGQGFQQEFEVIKEYFTGLPKNSKNIPHFTRQLQVINSKKEFRLGKLKILPVNVDHSIPGAMGFIVNGSKTIAYTGDLRMHGSNPEKTAEFVRAAKEARPDILITEGTRCGGDHRKMGLTEKECLDHLTEYMKKTKGLVVANFPPRDLDRINTFYEAAVANGRKLAIDTKMAYLLSLLQEDKSLSVPSPKDKHICIYIRKKGAGEGEEKEYKKWEREYLEYKNAVCCNEIDQAKTVLYLNAWNINELIDIKPMANSTYLYSLCAPFNDEMELDHERLMNWIKHFRLEYKEAHASGHASEEDIKKMVRDINAKEVKMVHSGGKIQ